MSPFHTHMLPCSWLPKFSFLRARHVRGDPGRFDGAAGGDGSHADHGYTVFYGFLGLDLAGCDSPDFCLRSSPSACSFLPRVRKGGATLRSMLVPCFRRRWFPQGEDLRVSRGSSQHHHCQSANVYSVRRGIVENSGDAVSYTGPRWNCTDPPKKESHHPSSNSKDAKKGWFDAIRGARRKLQAISC